MGADPHFIKVRNLIARFRESDRVVCVCVCVCV